MNEILDALKAPFPEEQISWRVGAMTKDQSKGIALAYLDARDVMRRLDEVMGIDWQCRYSHVGDKGVVCEVGLRINGEWLWRANGAGETQVEAEKGALSDAFKRAAVLWGVGRYLYDLPNVWVELDNKRIKTPPGLPDWAKPKGQAGAQNAFSDRGDALGELLKALEDNDPWAVLNLSWTNEQGFRFAFGRLGAKQKAACRELEQEGATKRKTYIEDLNDLAEKDDPALAQFWNELPHELAQKMVWSGLTKPAKLKIHEIRKAA